MSNTLKRGLIALVRKLDLVLSPMTLASAMLLSAIRRAGMDRMPVSRAIFDRVGIFPILDHYYEPLFKTGNLARPLSSVRELPGIDMNPEGQLALLAKFHFEDELRKIPRNKKDGSKEIAYSYDSTSFGSGDSEFLYNIIRHFKPKRILEVGSGASTLMARNALEANIGEDPSYRCEHVCIEPYEAPWLEKIGVAVMRQPVESVGKSIFNALDQGDILFIDSSHIIRPQGDVLFLFLEVIPLLRAGVLIHIHDIFSPRDYLKEWVVDQVKFWNEQYLLEALLSDNPKLEVIGALNYLNSHYPDEISKVCPVLGEEIGFREPGSMWLVKR